MPLVHAAADAANNIVAGAPAFDAATIRAVRGTGQEPHAARSRTQHGADVDNLVTFLTAPAGRTRHAAGSAAAVAARPRPDPAHRPN